MRFASTLKNHIIVIAAGAIIVLIVVIAYYNNSKRKKIAAIIENTEQVLTQSNLLLIDLANHQTALRGYLITEKEIFLESYYNSIPEIKLHTNKLKELTRYNLHQQERLKLLDELIAERIELSSKVIDQIKQKKYSDAEKTIAVERGQIIWEKTNSKILEISISEYEFLKDVRSKNVRKIKFYNFLFSLITILSISTLLLFLDSIIKNQKISKQAEEEKHALELKAVQLKADKAIAEETARLAKISVDAKQQFLSTMSHEIRTPLNSILGFTNALMRTNLTENQKEYLSAIKSSGDSLIFLINEILDLAKVNAGKMTFEKKPFQINNSIKFIQNSFNLLLKEKNLEIIIEYDNKIPDTLLGDSIRLNQILLNLMSNAVKFTQKGKIILSVILLNDDDEKATIEFTITDTGIGIAEDKIDQVFNVFEQAEPGTTNSYSGSGLGLAIVKKLVEAQGGSIGLKSKLGEGSAFSFILSFEKTNLEAVSELQTNTKVLVSDSVTNSLRVLVAEDVALNQLLIKMILTDFNFECDIVANGKIAIEKMQTSNYDIILMDLNMPEMDGYEATEYIRKTMKSEIPVIALTADVTATDLKKCKEYGINDYISKPFDEQLLFSKIVELTEHTSRI